MQSENREISNPEIIEQWTNLTKASLIILRAYTCLTIKNLPEILQSIYSSKEINPNIVLSPIRARITAIIELLNTSPADSQIIKSIALEIFPLIPTSCDAIINPIKGTYFYPCSLNPLVNDLGALSEAVQKYLGKEVNYNVQKSIKENGRDIEAILEILYKYQIIESESNLMAMQNQNLPWDSEVSNRVKTRQGKAV